MSGTIYITAALELAKWTLDFVQRTNDGEMTEEEMRAEWESRVRADVREANALWQAGKDRAKEDL